MLTSAQGRGLIQAILNNSTTIRHYTNPEAIMTTIIPESPFTHARLLPAMAGFVTELPKRSLKEKDLGLIISNLIYLTNNQPDQFYTLFPSAFFSFVLTAQQIHISQTSGILGLSGSLTSEYRTSNLIERQLQIDTISTKTRDKIIAAKCDFDEDQLASVSRMIDCGTVSFKTFGTPSEKLEFAQAKVSEKSTLNLIYEALQESSDSTSTSAGASAGAGSGAAESLETTRSCPISSPPTKISTAIRDLITTYNAYQFNKDLATQLDPLLKKEIEGDDKSTIDQFIERLEIIDHKHEQSRHMLILSKTTCSISAYPATLCSLLFWFDASRHLSPELTVVPIQSASDQLIDWMKTMKPKEGGLEAKLN